MHVCFQIKYCRTLWNFDQIWISSAPFEFEKC